MPRTRFSREQDQLRDLAKLIEAWRRYHDLTPVEMAVKMGISQQTYRRRISSPKDFTIKEIWTACQILKIPFEESSAAIVAGCKLEDMKVRTR